MSEMKILHDEAGMPYVKEYATSLAVMADLDRLTALLEKEKELRKLKRDLRKRIKLWREEVSNPDQQDWGLAIAAGDVEELLAKK